MFTTTTMWSSKENFVATCSRQFGVPVNQKCITSLVGNGSPLAREMFCTRSWRHIYMNPVPNIRKAPMDALRGGHSLPVGSGVVAS